MTKRLVLMGAQEGPWCAIREVRNPTLHVRGLKEGMTLSVMLKSAAKSLMREFSENGQHSLGERYEWIQVSASEPHNFLICTVEPAA